MKKPYKALLTTFLLSSIGISIQAHAGSLDYQNYCFPQKDNGDGGYDDGIVVQPELPYRASDGLIKEGECTVIGSLVANQYAANNLFSMRLEDRVGASRFQKPNQELGDVWIRGYAGHNKFKSLFNDLKTSGDSYTIQIGSDLFKLGDQDQFVLGVMGGYAHYDSKTKPKLWARKGSSKVHGYSVGAYSTWYAFPVEQRGAYIDTWVLWNKFKNEVETSGLPDYKYDSSGITASIEVGGDYLLNKNGSRNLWIQPQSQLIYQGVDADEFNAKEGLNVSSGNHNLQARMGAKTYLEIDNANGFFKSYRPYVALNFIHNTEPYTMKVNDAKFYAHGSENLGEIKLGLEANLNKNSLFWVNTSFVGGSKSNQTYQGNIGWKYNF